MILGLLRVLAEEKKLEPLLDGAKKAAEEKAEQSKKQKTSD